MTNIPHIGPDIASVVREFIVANFLFGDREGLDDEGSLIDGGVIDSTGVVELVAFLEQQFAVAIADAELVPENFDSIRRIAAFVDRKAGG